MFVFSLQVVGYNITCAASVISSFVLSSVCKVRQIHEGTPDSLLHHCDCPGVVKYVEQNLSASVFWLLFCREVEVLR